MSTQSIIETYHRQVVNKFQIYNSLFLNLPFDQIHQVGVLLPLLNQACQKAYLKGQSPFQIIESFLNGQLGEQTEKERIAVLFKFIQYIERQIVLFDATEEAAFANNHDFDGEGSLPYMSQRSHFLGLSESLKKQMASYHARVVLTAHPTQFYPGVVLGIISELAAAIQADDVDTIAMLLKQLGKTPLYKKEKPTPYDEAVSLTWYLENVFYQAAQEINNRIDQFIYKEDDLPENRFIEVGFWPGGDRDGNSNVTAQITRKVGRRLRSSILKCYFRHIRKLKRRLTFSRVEQMVSSIEKRLYEGAYTDPEIYTYSAEQFYDDLKAIKKRLEQDHQSLFVDQVVVLMRQVMTFGFFFASIDVRQDSRVIMSVLDKVNTMVAIDDALVVDTLGSIQAIQAIQSENGQAGAHRYIISNCQDEMHILAVLSLMEKAGLNKPYNVDVVPLFETIDDLKMAPTIMQTLYQHRGYREHLGNRNRQQTIMLGFSDGTKDGGYIAANWAILRAKETLSQVAKDHGITVSFFDGRGGPPARGGGATHRFYASLSPEIQNHVTQLTVQGQTISANFGHPETAQFNLERLLSAGVSNAMTPPKEAWPDDVYEVMSQLTKTSLSAYRAFKDHPQFVPYLEQVSTLKYYGQTNISSRPIKRKSDSGSLNFEDLRAIPFVGAWSQLKQNVLGYYGVGTALQQAINDGQLSQLQNLYQVSGFFKTLMDNCMMSIAKSFMPLTAYLQDDVTFGTFWRLIYDEFMAAKNALLLVSQQQELLANQPLRKASIAARESIVLPLLTIQQYAIQKVDQLKRQNPCDEQLPVYESMVVRSLYGNINASRNAV